MRGGRPVMDLVAMHNVFTAVTAVLAATGIWDGMLAHDNTLNGSS